MIIVYHYAHIKGPQKHEDGIYVLPIKDDDFGETLNRIENAGYPFPTSDIVFIEGDTEINRWNPFED